MQAKIVSIGNSQGVRIPKSLLEESGILPNQPVTLTVVNNSIVIAPARNPREGWAEAFAKSAAEVSAEDRDWLEAELTDSKDWTW